MSNATDMLCLKIPIRQPVCFPEKKKLALIRRWVWGIGALVVVTDRL